MEQGIDMGVSLELATQALAATGSKSTLKATDWILNHRRMEVSKAAGTASSRQQLKMDQFFQGNVSGLVGTGAVALSGAGESNLLDEATPDAEVGGGGLAGEGGASGWRNVNPTPERGREEDTPLFAGGKGGDRGYQGGSTLTRSPTGEIVGVGPSTYVANKRTSAVDTVQENSAPKRQRLYEQEAYDRAPPLSPFYSPSPSGFKQKRGGGKFLPPLAERMRPVTVDDVVGQDHLLGPRRILRSLLKSEVVPSIILWGPPGTGKTSLARAIARSVPYKFVDLSAVNSSTKEVREVLEEAKASKKYGHRTLLFLDEVHRFNKSQQDVFLPAIEAGHIVFIGATTENPSFEINAPLLSRCRVLMLHKLQSVQLRQVLEMAMADQDRGVSVSLPGMVSNADLVIRMEEEALDFLAGAADGDARVALNAIEIATVSSYGEELSQRKAQLQELVGRGLERAGSSSGMKESVNVGLLTGEKSQSFNCFCLKRLELLRGNAKEHLNSKVDYTKPFKKFVRGKEVTPVQSIRRYDRDNLTVASDRGKDGIGAQSEGDEVGMVTETGDRKFSIPDGYIVEEHFQNNILEGMVVTVTLAHVREALQRSHIVYDKTGEEHYNTISALHKSMRGGDPDAAIYWLARILEGGEGPLYVARRLVRFASEDVGLADPLAMGIAVACYQACHFLGMPECNVNLAQCVVYLALAPKSVVVYQAIESAQKLVREMEHYEPVPLHLRNAPTRLMKDLGYGKGYIYPPGQIRLIEQDYLPPSLQGLKFLHWPEENCNDQLL